MKAIQLHDKDEEIIGTILVTEKNTEEDIKNAWDEYLAIEKEGCWSIWDFVIAFPKMDMEVLEIDFYQPL
jgi:hypothetical protein